MSKTVGTYSLCATGEPRCQRALHATYRKCVGGVRDEQARLPYCTIAHHHALDRLHLCHLPHRSAVHSSMPRSRLARNTCAPRLQCARCQQSCSYATSDPAKGALKQRVVPRLQALVPFTGREMRSWQGRPPTPPLGREAAHPRTEHSAGSPPHRHVNNFYTLRRVESVLSLIHI